MRFHASAWKHNYFFDPVACSRYVTDPAITDSAASSSISSNKMELYFHMNSPLTDEESIIDVIIPQLLQQSQSKKVTFKVTKYVRIDARE